MPTDARPDVLLLDTSTAVALVVEDHDAHDATLEAVLGRKLGLAGHAWFETYSVLTRLPAGLRRTPADAYRLMLRNFPESAFLGEAAAAGLVTELAQSGISGGAVYDALVGAAARQHRCRLVTRDARALPVYNALAVEARLIS